MELQFTVYNDAPANGLWLSPTWIGLHDGSFNLFDIGAEASPGLEQLAEDGLPATLDAEFAAFAPAGQSITLETPPNQFLPSSDIQPFFYPSAIVEIDPETQGHFSFASSILPSNDAFIGSLESIDLFDEEGNFLGEQNFELFGDDVFDAGTEFNTERDAALINQTEPNTGIDGNGVVGPHPGFNGSAGNPISEGQVILGGTNEFGNFIDPIAADFTLPDAEVATVHVNTVSRFTGSSVDDVFVGGGSNDLVNGGAGDDRLIGGDGWDWLEGGEGDDFLIGGDGNDTLIGGSITGGGGGGNDVMFGGDGDDGFVGSSGDDVLHLGEGDDGFQVTTGHDVVLDFTSGEDVIMLFAIEGIDDFSSAIAAATDFGAGTTFDFGDSLGAPTELTLLGVSRGDLDAGDFLFF